MTTDAQVETITPTSVEKKEPNLLDRLGGTEALDAVVEIFYGRVTTDERLTTFFEGVSITRLKVHQRKFLTMAFTEIPADIDVAKYMIDKHARLFQEKGLNASHFDMIAGHLVASLQQLNVPENLIAEVVAIVGPLRPVFDDEAERILNENNKN